MDPLESYIDSIQIESDRGAALLGAELLSDALTTHLRSKTVGNKKLKDSLFTGMGPLSSFSAKLKTAYSFGLVPKIFYTEMEAIRKIRNHAAHSVSDFRFDCSEVLPNISKMKIFERIIKDIDNGRKPDIVNDAQAEICIKLCKKYELFTNRAKYNYTVAIIYGYLTK